MTLPDLRAALAASELLFDGDALRRETRRIAADIDAHYAGGERPVYLTIMHGGLIFAAELALAMKTDLEFDYLHATRYRDGTRGGAIEWAVLPRKDISGRAVLLLDDILDEGHTLAAAKARLLEMGAAEVKIAVLADKDIGVAKPVAADFVGLALPNRYVLGMGMDAYGLWRNLPGIYALKEEN